MNSKNFKIVIDEDNEHEDFYLQIHFVRLGHLWHRNVTTPKCGFLGQKVGKSIQYLCIQNMEKCSLYFWLFQSHWLYMIIDYGVRQQWIRCFAIILTTIHAHFRLARQCQLVVLFCNAACPSWCKSNHNTVLDDHLLGHWWRHDSFLIRHVSGTALQTGETLINVTKLSRFEYPDTCLCRKHLWLWFSQAWAPYPWWCASQWCRRKNCNNSKWCQSVFMNM